MRVYWWQDGLHIGPESKAEYEILSKAWYFLEGLEGLTFEFPDRSHGLKFAKNSDAGASGKGDDQ